MPTYLVGDSKRSVKAVVLDDGAASLRRADGADVRHAEGVAGVVATEVLDRGNAVSTIQNKGGGGQFSKGRSNNNDALCVTPATGVLACLDFPASPFTLRSSEPRAVGPSTAALMFLLFQFSLQVDCLNQTASNVAEVTE